MQQLMRHLLPWAAESSSDTQIRRYYPTVGRNDLLGETRTNLDTTLQVAWAKQLIAANDVNDVNDLAFLPIKDTAWGFDNLAVTASLWL